MEACLLSLNVLFVPQRLPAVGRCEEKAGESDPRLTGLLATA